MRASVVKWLPSLAVSTLVVLAAGAHTGPPRLPIPTIEVTATRLSRPLAAAASGICTRTATDYKGNAVVLFPSSDLAIAQAITPRATIVSSSFALPATADAVTYTTRRFAEVPGAGSVSGTSFPLDARGGVATLTADIECEVTYGRPIVTESLSGVADPFVGPGGGCIELQISNLSGGPTGIVLADLEPNAPHASAQVPGQPASTKLAHAVRLSECSPDEPLGPLKALQQVVHGLQPVALPGVTELAQRFTVSATGTALWFEIPTVPSGSISRVTAELQPATGTANQLPAGAFAVTVTSGDLDLDYSPQAGPVWRAAGSLLPALLVPGQEYVFVVRFEADQFIPVLDLSGRDVLARPLYSRADSNSPWVAIPGANLGLRVIGVAGPIPEPSCDFMVYDQTTRTASITLGGGATLTALLQRVGEPGGTPPWSSGFIAMSSGPVGTTRTAELYLGDGPAAAGEIAVALARGVPQVTATSDVDLGWTDFSFARPMVTVTVTGTAQTVSGTTAFSVVVDPSSDGLPSSATFTASYRTADCCPSQVSPSAGLLVRTASGWESAPGANPQLGLKLCGSTDPSSNALRVLQQVPHADELVIATLTALIQRFTVPTDGYVKWVEMPLRAATLRSGLDPPPPHVTLYSARTVTGTGTLGKGITLTAGFLTLPTLPGAGDALWASTESFASPPLLHAGQDYLLELTFPEPETFMPHLSHAPVDPAWTLGVSTPLTGTATIRSGTACFRLIGWPAAAPVGVPPTTIRLDGLELEAYPNPSGAQLSLRWHGGRGVTQLEIIDVRGRRVRRITAGDARAGSFIWDGRDSAGNLVPPGVYFASARDGSSSAPSRRLIRIR